MYGRVYKCIKHTDIWEDLLGTTDVWGHTDMQGYKDVWRAYRCMRDVQMYGCTDVGGHTDIPRHTDTSPCLPTTPGYYISYKI